MRIVVLPFNVDVNNAVEFYVDPTHSCFCQRGDFINSINAKISALEAILSQLNEATSQFKDFRSVACHEGEFMFRMWSDDCQYIYNLFIYGIILCSAQSSSLMLLEQHCQLSIRALIYSLNSIKLLLSEVLK